MNLVTGSAPVVLWQDVVRHAESRCQIALTEDLEAYLVSLLIRYSTQPDIAKQVVAMAFLEALQLREKEKEWSLQCVGDQCLLFAGLFPRFAERRQVKLTYFVDMGRAAYGAVSRTTNDLYGSLAMQFVVLMDVLQSIRPHADLLPLEAYDQWNELGSQRAFRILQDYRFSGIPFKK